MTDDNLVPLVAPKSADRCPECAKPTLQAHKPFCSKRCADLDLGRWFNESYRIPSNSKYGDDDD